MFLFYLKMMQWLLKKKGPSDYQIIEKNGRKVKDKIKPKIKEDENSIFSKVVEKE